MEKTHSLSTPRRASWRLYGNKFSKHKLSQSQFNLKAVSPQSPEPWLAYFSGNLYHLRCTRDHDRDSAPHLASSLHPININHRPLKTLTLSRPPFIMMQPTFASVCVSIDSYKLIYSRRGVIPGPKPLCRFWRS